MDISQSKQGLSTLTAESLSVVRGDRVVIDGLSIDVRSGEALILVGPNGSGKTTLLRALAGLLPWAAGGPRMIAGDGSAEPWLPIGACHYIGHTIPVKSKLTVLENAGFWCRYLAPHYASPGDYIGPALEAFDLMDLGHVPAAFLSAGQRRRLSLSRLLLAPRPVWLLDEPATSLDRSSIERLVGTIDAHLSAGGMVIAATHQPLALSRQRQIDLGHAGEGE
jgi:heme exporter protein A